jgi:5-methylthioadenosine/S-adenosylhomocysteine deaminase
VWSPFANFWLYGATASITAAKAAGVRIALRSDGPLRAPQHPLGAQRRRPVEPSPTHPLFTDQELAQLVTTNPGHALTEVWPQPVGTIQAGALADLIVMRRRLPDPYRNLIQATETTSASS